MFVLVFKSDNIQVNNEMLEQGNLITLANLKIYTVSATLTAVRYYKFTSSHNHVHYVQKFGEIKLVYNIV